jgi:hypothetical protein
MADFKPFSYEDELKTVDGRISVITVEPGPIAAIPEAIIIDVYVDGEKQKGEEQVFETSDIGDDILKADLEDNVYICTDAINLYEAMKENAQLYQDVGGNLEAYADKLDERMQEEAEAARENEDDSEWDLHF